LAGVIDVFTRPTTQDKKEPIVDVVVEVRKPPPKGEEDDDGYFPLKLHNNDM